MFKNLEGKRVPDVTFRTRRDHEWVDVTSAGVFDGKTGQGTQDHGFRLESQSCSDANAYVVVFPLVFAFLTGVAPEGVAVMTDITHYLDFVLTLFFAFGLAFEVPIATIVLVLAGALPIRAAGMLLGAVGVSGAPGGDKDEACARQALEGFQERLEFAD